MKAKQPKRTLPYRVIGYYEVAKKYKLSYPLGRALYVVNRIQNEGQADNIDHWKTVLINTKPETAKKWLSHWNNGGHIKSLGSIEEYLKRRRYREGILRAIKRTDKNREKEKNGCMGHYP